MVDIASLLENCHWLIDSSEDKERARRTLDNMREAGRQEGYNEAQEDVCAATVTAKCNACGGIGIIENTDIADYKSTCLGCDGAGFRIVREEFKLPL